MLILIILNVVVLTLAVRNNTVGMRQLLSFNGQSIQGQWTRDQNHLINVLIQKEETWKIEITPYQTNLFNAKHDYRLSFYLDAVNYNYDVNEQQHIWLNLTVEIMLGNRIRGYRFYNCSSNLMIELIGNQDQQKFIVSSEFDQTCPLSQDRVKRFTFSDEAFKQQTISFAILTTLVSLIQIFFSIRIIRSKNNDISQATLNIVMLQDVFMCLFSALLFDMYSQWIYYLIPVIIAQLIAILLDLQVKLFAQDQEQNQSLQKILKNVASGILLFVGLGYLFAGIRHNNQLILLNLYMVPQIWDTYQKGKRKVFDWSYVFGLLLPRSLIALYLRGCPLNWLQLSLNYNTCFIIVLLCGLQIAIYYSQCKWGWFLRKNDGHQYFIKSANNSSDCVICLSRLTTQTDVEMDVFNNADPHIRSTIEDANRKSMLMITPCNHCFHTNCLINWMQVNPVCPLCKQSLPQIM